MKQVSLVVMGIFLLMPSVGAQDRQFGQEGGINRTEWITVTLGDTAGVTGWWWRSQDGDYVNHPNPEGIGTGINGQQLHFVSPFTLPAHPTSGTTIDQMEFLTARQRGHWTNTNYTLIERGPEYQAKVFWEASNFTSFVSPNDPRTLDVQLKVDFFDEDGRPVGTYDEVKTLYGYRTADALARARDEQTGPFATPEPTSMALFGLGSLGMAWVKRRRGKHAPSICAKT